MIIVSVILQLTDLAFSTEVPAAKYIVHLFFLGGVILNAKVFSDKNQNNVMFGQVFSSGFKMTAVVLLLNVIWGAIALQWVFPDSQEKVLSFMMEQGTKEGFSKEVLEERYKPVRENFVLFTLSGQTFLILFSGALFSLIGAGIAKKKKIETQG